MQTDIDTIDTKVDAILVTVSNFGTVIDDLIKYQRNKSVIDPVNHTLTIFEDDGTTSIPYPYDGLNEKLYGITTPSLITVVAGTGLGKSAFLREIQHYLITQTDVKIGILALEEAVQHTLWSLIGLEAEKHYVMT